VINCVDTWDCFEYHKMKKNKFLSAEKRQIGRSGGL
jgi:hypothetical protein